MKTTLLLALALLPLSSPPASRADETNAPRTRFEAVEAVTGRVMIKGTEDIGSVAGKTGVVLVRCAELRDAATGQREYGLIITVRQNEQLEDTSVIDGDEVAALLQGVDYISKADPRISSLNHFEAAYTTRSGLRVVSYSSRRTSTTEAAVSSNRYTRSRALLNLGQLSELKTLLEQAQAKLDSIRQAK
jgi:hypothetical protein